MTPKFNVELLKQEERIIKVLDQEKIRHGHAFVRRNFCLRFFRDENGNVDLEKCPRVYLIDFDQAVSPEGIE